MATSPSTSRDERTDPRALPSREDKTPPSESNQTTDAPPYMEKVAVLLGEVSAAVQGDCATDSLALAHRDRNQKGAVQTHAHGKQNLEIRNLGWNESNQNILDPLVGGHSNGELWSYIRRFNKDVSDVRSISIATVKGLDLNQAWDEEHATERLTLNLQRTYLTIVLGLVSFGNQLARLRSWKETRRTAAFCLVYFTSLYLDLTSSLLLGMLAFLIAYPPSQSFLFPSAPRALVDMSTGGLQKPQAGLLGTSNTLAGASEGQDDEAVEDEAEYFADNVRHLARRMVVMHEQEHLHGDPLEGKVPKPIRKAVKVAKSKYADPGHSADDPTSVHTQQPMEEIIWSVAKPENLWPVSKSFPYAVGELADYWERISNALSPSPPFPKYTYVRLLAVILSIFLMSYFITPYMIRKGTWLAIGVGIFGDPILTPAFKWLIHTYPNWIQLLEPKNNILKNVPTNSQMTLTLLRIGEANRTPLPPIPRSDDKAAARVEQVRPNDVPLDTSTEEIEDAIYPSHMPKAYKNDTSDQQKPMEKRNRLSKFFVFIRGNTEAGIKTKLAVNHVRAAMGSNNAKARLGVIPKPKNLIYAGPTEFKGRFDGKEGWVYIIDSPNTPCLAFAVCENFPSETYNGGPEALFTLPISEIERLKRLPAFLSLPTEKTADWSTDKDLLGSVEVVDIRGRAYRFTALPERDGLFNRLIAIGQQRWENF